MPAQKETESSRANMGELCEFRVMFNNGFLGWSSWSINTVVTGPQGRKVTQLEKINTGFGQSENKEKVQARMDELAGELAKNGWQPIPSERSEGRYVGLELPRLRRQT